MIRLGLIFPHWNGTEEETQSPSQTWHTQHLRIRSRNRLGTRRANDGLTIQRRQTQRKRLQIRIPVGSQADEERHGDSVPQGSCLIWQEKAAGMGWHAISYSGGTEGRSLMPKRDLCYRVLTIAAHRRQRKVSVWDCSSVCTRYQRKGSVAEAAWFFFS